MQAPINDYADFFEGFDELHDGELGGALLEGEPVDLEEDDEELMALRARAFADDEEDEDDPFYQRAGDLSPASEPPVAPKPKKKTRPGAELTGAERRALRALGHHLKAIIQIGQKGVTPALIEAVEVALSQHALLKLSINSESPTERKEGAEALAKATKSHVAQVIGRTILLYRDDERRPKVQFSYKSGKVSADWAPKWSAEPPKVKGEPVKGTKKATKRGARGGSAKRGAKR
jgi:RNA-binding protein